MRLPALPFSLLLITDEAAAQRRARGTIETVARALGDDATGVAVLLRAKGHDIAAVRPLARALRAITHAVGARLLVHSHVALVAELDLAGAHVDANTDGAAARAALPTGALLGASRHADDALNGAAALGLDYMLFGPVFRARSKPGDVRPPIGTAGLARAASSATLPLVAVGGIGVENAAEVARTGVAAFACIDAIAGAHDPLRARRALLREWAS